MKKSSFVIGANTAKVVDLVISVDNLSKQMSKAFVELYGENKADEFLKEFNEVFTNLNEGLKKHIGNLMYEEITNQD